MGLRFRKSVKLAPGVRLTAGKRGMGVSLGGRGGGISVGPGGARARASIPGTGISYSEKLGGSKSSGRTRASARETESVQVSVRVHVDEDTGAVSYTDENGDALPPKVEAEAKRQGKERLQELLESTAEKINGEVRELTRLHLATPDPRTPARFEAEPFDEPRPSEPRDLPRKGILGTLLPPLGKSRERRAQHIRDRHGHELQQWTARRNEHDQREAERKARFDSAQTGDTTAMEALLEERLGAVAWPYETLVDFDIVDAQTIALDVDLPEIEDLPVKQCSVAARGNKLNMKTISDKQKRLLYLTHVHSIGFRLPGEVFSAFPTVQTVVISAYSQRVDAGSGHEQDGKRIALGGKDWKRVLKKAKIEDFRWHDLRHTWASWHVMNGTTLQELMKLAGWSTYDMALRYRPPRPGPPGRSGLERRATE